MKGYSTLPEYACFLIGAMGVCVLTAILAVLQGCSEPPNKKEAEQLTIYTVKPVGYIGGYGMRNYPLYVVNIEGVEYYACKHEYGWALAQKIQGKAEKPIN